MHQTSRPTFSKFPFIRWDIFLIVWKNTIKSPNLSVQNSESLAKQFSMQFFLLQNALLTSSMQKMFPLPSNQFLFCQQLPTILPLVAAMRMCEWKRDFPWPVGIATIRRWKFERRQKRPRGGICWRGSLAQNAASPRGIRRRDKAPERRRGSWRATGQKPTRFFIS